ncbi:MAG: metallophosphoesterase [Oscillospiraceae bacterium]|nr:metallophosphoesterase [Oscillospiraceae bacterium]
MKVLVIPDVHLKPWMFDRAHELLEQGCAEKAVCLMDIPDDWNQEYNLDLYAQTYDRAIRFQKDHPDTLWCYGNHDLCYVWDQRETGFSIYALQTVTDRIRELKRNLPERSQLAYIHRIDDVLFLHGGLTDGFVRRYVPAKVYNDTDEVVRRINALGMEEMWSDWSPIWYRPQYESSRMYKPRRLLQVVGHTPMENLGRDGNVVSCDVFSTYRNGQPIGPQEFPVIDTETWEFVGIQ